MGNILHSYSYNKRSVTIPNNSPLFTHLCQDEEREREKKYHEKNYNQSQICVLCCKERDGYGVGEFNRIYI